MDINLQSVFGPMADREKAIKPTPAAYETIEVEFSLDAIFDEYIGALEWKLESDERGNRLNQLVELTRDEIRYYFGFILQQRIKRCQGEKVNFNLLNSMCVPAFFITAIAMVGNYDDPVRGFSFRPVTSDTTIYDEGKVEEIATKFMRLRDVFQSAIGAAPRHPDGDPEVMTMACIEGHVRSMSEVSHPLMTYFSAFLNGKVTEEVATRGLYCLQYDNLIQLGMIFRNQGECLC